MQTSSFSDNRGMPAQLFDVAEVGRWVMPMDTCICTFDPALLQIVGMKAVRKSMHIDEYFVHVHRDDRLSLHELLAHVHETQDRFDVTFRLIRPLDGRTAWINSRGKVVDDETTGTPTIRGAITTSPRSRT